VTPRLGLPGYTGGTGRSAQDKKVSNTDGECDLGHCIFQVEIRSNARLPKHSDMLLFVATGHDTGKNAFPVQCLRRTETSLILRLAYQTGDQHR
jgi:hypothetical protein